MSNQSTSTPGAKRSMPRKSPEELKASLQVSVVYNICINSVVGGCGGCMIIVACCIICDSN